MTACVLHLVLEKARQEHVKTTGTRPKKALVVIPDRNYRGRERARKGGRERGREGEREGEREGGREEEREGGREGRMVGGGKPSEAG